MHHSSDYFGLEFQASNWVEKNQWNDLKSIMIIIQLKDTYENTAELLEFNVF